MLAHCTGRPEVGLACPPSDRLGRSESRWLARALHIVNDIMDIIAGLQRTQVYSYLRGVIVSILRIKFAVVVVTSVAST